MKHSEATKLKMSLAAKGRIFTEEHKRNLSLSHKGQISTRKGTGKKYECNCLNCNILLILNSDQYGSKRRNKYGIFCSLQCSQDYFRGERSPNWRGGIPLSRALRQTLEYKGWRTAVFERDNYTCVLCGIKGGKLQADHIKRFSDYPELRYAIDNGRTLCEDCHRTTPNYGRRSG